MIRWIVLFLLGSQVAAVSQSQIKPTSTVEFSLSNMGVRTVNGSFGGMKGNVSIGEGDLTSGSFDVTVDVNSINTANEKRDNHLREPDFFEAETYPTIRLVSTSIEKNNSGYVFKGNLTIRDVTRAIQFPFAVTQENAQTRLSGSFQIKRLDYGVGVDYGGFTVGKVVTVNINCLVD